MDFELPEELRLLQQTMRNFVDRELIPVEMHAMDGPNMRPEIRADLEAKAKKLGLWNLDVPVEYGGQGLNLLGMTVVWQEMARTVALPPRGPYVFGPDVKPILYTLNDKQKEKYLFPVLRGEKKTAFAQSEPDAGSDPGAMRTTAVRKGDTYVINGYKRWITSAHGADFVQLVAATDRSKGSRGGLSMFLVDTNTPGFKIVRRTETMMGDAPAEIALDDVVVPAENMIGKEGDGMKAAQGWITAGRLYQACRGLGVAKRSMELMIDYAKQRVTFGAPLADRQAVQFKIADSYTEHHMVQLMVHQLAARTDAGAAGRHESFMTKIAGTELGFRVADRCMQIYGGMGLATEMPISKMWRDARSFMITEGPVEVMRMVLAREILREHN
ncbi:acyl-CoA dehydrogenase family protein [Leptospira sp. severe_002]|uniref:acyl-CoA dehydrogenase family protein n=1 Tax=Leptospira sp. severe_002 TaxID=2838237 RepID=UPI001E3685FE|nr:acyl-CoA dehydrogenase family protein [Leptospira sp. severe_002]